MLSLAQMGTVAGQKMGAFIGEKLDEKGVVTFRELLMSNCIQVDAVAQLLIEKGLITEKEYL